MTLFTPAQLKTWLRYDDGDVFVEETALLVEKVVAGWLTAEVGTIPDTLDEGSPLFGWAIELGGIAYENPTSMANDASGETQSAWFVTTRQNILRSVRAWAQAEGMLPAPATSALPRGKFPPAPAWPDAYTPRRRYR